MRPQVCLTAVAVWVAALGLPDAALASIVDDERAELDDMYASVMGGGTPQREARQHTRQRRRLRSRLRRRFHHHPKIASLFSVQSKLGLSDPDVVPAAAGPALQAKVPVAAVAEKTVVRATSQRGAEGAPSSPPHSTSHDSGADRSPGKVAAVFPKAHPIVDRTLSAMPRSIDRLHDREVARTRAQEELARASSSAIVRMNDAVSMQHDIREREADLRQRERKLLKLEHEVSTMKTKHDQLNAKVRAIMEPRVLNLEERVQQRQYENRKEKEDVLKWTKVSDEYKNSAISELETRHRWKDEYRKATGDVEKAQKYEDYAGSQYELAKEKSENVVEAYKYVYSHLQGKRSLEQRDEEISKDESTSLTRMRSIMQMQQHRVDSALAAELTKLQSEIKKTTADRDDALLHLQLERAQFRKWKIEERARVKEAARRKAAYDAAQTAFTNERRHVFDSASSAAAASAERSGDWAWDDWAWSAGGGGDPEGEGVTEDDVSLN